MTATMHEQVNQAAARQLLYNLRHDTVQQEPAVLRVPTAHFTDPVRAQAEMALFRTLPLVVGHHSELAEPGATMARQLLDTTVIVRRDHGDRIVGYQIAARETPADIGRWTSEQLASLAAVFVEQHSGLVWVDFSNQRDRSVADYLGDEVLHQLNQFELDRSVLFMHEQFDLDVNWKLVMDGACDILHLKFLHPNGVGKLLVTGRSVFVKHGRHGQNFTPRKRLEVLARESEPSDDDLDQVWRYVSGQIRLYPNAMNIIAPDHIEFWTVLPTADPSRCRVDIRFLVRPELLDDEMAARIRYSWEILREAAFTEDFPMEISIQRNAVAHPDSEFTYGCNETSIRHLHDCLARDLNELDAR
ncbi:MAG TPA: SRPBCC family protein [Ilumatobacteraceae bacterium]|nr:SRPBCC family protein [Ilumatobacteraceae bacterium]